MRRYLVHMFLAALCWAAALLGFNWYVDPYGIFHPDPQRPPALRSERIFKTVYLARQPADTLLLGTSRVDLGFSREQLPRTNSLASFGQPIHETYRLVQQALQFHTPKHLLIGLDFFAFNSLFPTPSDFTEANYDSARPLHLAFSISTAMDAWQSWRKPGQGDGCCYANGFRALPTPAGINYPQAFRNNERTYLLEKYRPFPACRFSYDYTQPKGNAHSTLDELRLLLQLVRSKGVAVTLFITPSHARQWETLAAAGLWADWEDWKRHLLDISLAAGDGVQLWDFSGYSQISTETVPAVGTQTIMQGYTDSAHFTPVVGAQVLARLHGAVSPSDFGARLTIHNLENHLAWIRHERARYRATHTADIEAIRAVADEVSQLKHCQQ